MLKNPLFISHPIYLANLFHTLSKNQMKSSFHGTRWTKFTYFNRSLSVEEKTWVSESRGLNPKSVIITSNSVTSFKSFNSPNFGCSHRKKKL
jgi:hypothetical protein